MLSSNRKTHIARVSAIVAALLLFAVSAPTADAKKLWKKTWRVTVDVAASPAGNFLGQRTYVIKARKINFSPSPLPLRKLTATTEDGLEQELEGVWRQEGKKFSLTFELQCEPGEVCGSVILRGRFTSSTTMSGTAIVVWDTPDRDNVARFDTANGTFEGTRN